MKKENTVSLCMIVCNEESNLPACLDIVKPIVDEIIIVDTGSTDQTLSIAQKAGARIFSFPWQNNFALARNFSLLKATGDWILVLDADEILSSCTLGQFQELMNHKNIDGYFFPIRNVLQESNQETLDYVVRLFRNKPHFQFEGALHEQILPSILRSEGRSALAHAPFPIFHFGYHAHKVDNKKKFERNRQILEKELAQNPKNPFYLYCLGLEYVQQNEFKTGISYLEAALNHVSQEEGYYADLLLSLALSYLKTERLSQLFLILDQGLNTHERHGDFLILYAIGHLLAQEPFKAIERIKQALEIKNNPSEIFSYSQIYSLLGDSYTQTHFTQAAIDAYLEALKTIPYSLYPFLQILNLLRQTYTLEELEGKEDLLNRISGFASPELQINMAAKLEREENLFLATLLRLCASISLLSLPTHRSLDISILSREIISCINTFDLNQVSSVIAKSLVLLSSELEICCQFIVHFPEEQGLVNHLPLIFYKMFVLITFSYLPPITQSDCPLNWVPNLSFTKQEGG